ncbi:hypothetical protein MSG28_015803 [Choristoneura fumiferana]|uniref:Uncharacterized protein n=1 Tax=Choristoneura fumiferana TaxID=7141 RepID=A0ACC0KBL2_CHOFU|nr:hypothetical protein MSG28_015803 [Choristoneura fumiferana]
MPEIGTFQYKFKGFKRPPADHYLRAFFLEEQEKKNTRWWKDKRGMTLQYDYALLKDQPLSDPLKRFAKYRKTVQGKLEERLPLMALLLPSKLLRTRPDAAKALRGNARVLTTPHDLHATLLDVLGMSQYANTYKVVVGPGRAVFEASLTHVVNEDYFLIHPGDISRTNA